ACIQLSALFLWSVAYGLKADSAREPEGLHERTASVGRRLAVAFNHRHFRARWSIGRIVCGGTGRWSHGDAQGDAGRRLQPGHLGLYLHAFARIGALGSVALRIRFE